MESITEYASSGEKAVVRQEFLAEFVDCARRITENLSVGRRFKHDPRSFIYRQLPDTGFTDQDRWETLHMLDAILYAAAQPKLDLVEVQKRIVGGKTHSSQFRLPSSQNDLSALVQDVEARLNELHERVELDVSLYFDLAADALKRLQSLRPFVDGNARLGEVMSAVILKKVSPFPHRVYPAGPPLFTQFCKVARDGSASHEEIRGLMIQMASRRVKEMNEMNEDGGRGDFELNMDVAW